jgi:multimeric flavodoxin WrbA
MLSAIALFSSSRRRGNTGRLIDRIALELNIEVVDLAGQRISSYDYEHLNRDDDFEPLMKRVLEHEQIIFATPIYWYAVSPAMKVLSAAHDPEALKLAALVREAIPVPVEPQS